jgi:lipid A 4'-phosphatase
VAVGIVLAIATRRHLLGLGLPQWLFLAAVLAVGPGLIANTMLKDNWARPRPTQIVEFGGSQPFTPVLERSGQCDRNCSFVSGETASIFALGFAVALLARRRRATLMGVAVLAGSLIGFIRIGEGGHFLSDVVFAGVFMGLVVALLHWIVFGLSRGRLGDEARWHDMAVAGAHRLRASGARLGAAAADWTRRQYRRERD